MGLSELARQKFPPVKLTKEEIANLPGKRCTKKKADRTPSEDADHLIWNRHYLDLRKSRGQAERDKFYQATYQERYRANHQDKLKAYYHKLYAENYEYFADGERKRRAMQAKVYSEPYTKQDVLNRWGTTCHLCTEEIDLETSRHAGAGPEWERGLQLDHVIPIGQGGPDIVGNVKPAHAICNLRRSKTPLSLDELPSVVDDKVLELISKDEVFESRRLGRKKLPR